MPWRPSCHRLLAHRKAKRFWESLGLEVLELDTWHIPYNLSAVRNLCVRTAQAAGAEVCIIADADVLLSNPNSICAAIEKASVPNSGLHLPFHRQVYLSAEQTLAASAVPVVVSGVTVTDMHLGSGCCYIIRPDEYWKIGGSDERFHGWGGEDEALCFAAETLGSVTRYPGIAFSLFHADANRDIGSERWQPNSDLAGRYREANGNSDQMLKLISEPNRN